MYTNEPQIVVNESALTRREADDLRAEAQKLRDKETALALAGATIAERRRVINSAKVYDQRAIWRDRIADALEVLEGKTQAQIRADMEQLENKYKEGKG